MLNSLFNKRAQGFSRDDIRLQADRVSTKLRKQRENLASDKSLPLRVLGEVYYGVCIMNSMEKLATMLGVRPENLA